MNIVGIGDWSTDFTGSPTIESRLTLGSALDLSAIQNLRFLISSTGDHSGWKLRCENSPTAYFEFDLGLAGTTGDQESVVKMDKMTITGVNDPDPTAITAIYIYATATTGSLTVDKTKVGVSADDFVATTVGFCEGFATELQSRISVSSSTIQTAIRPVDPQNGEYINETYFVCSAKTKQDLLEFGGTTKISEVMGEVFWVEFLSQNPTTGVVTWTILARGISEPGLPIRMGDMRNSLRVDHAKLNDCSIALYKSVLEAALAEVEQIGGSLKFMQVFCFEGTTDVSVGDGRAYFTIPSKLDGRSLSIANATVITAGTTGNTTIQVHNVTNAEDILSTPITIATTETTGAGVIDSGAATVSTRDLLRIDIDSVSTTAPKGLIVNLEFLN